MKHHMKKVEHVKIWPEMKASELVSEMGKSGVMGAGRIAKAAEIYSKMLEDKECTIYFGQAGAMVPGGMKEIIIDMIRNHYIDVFVTTGATLTHDLVEALGYRHYQGSDKADDAKLREEKYDRMFDSYMPDEVYEGMEDFIEKNFDTLAEKETIKDFIWELGRLLPKGRNDSILRAAYEEKIPIFCPAISDSGIGLMIWGRLAKGKKIKTNAFEDLKEILDVAWTSKKSGVFYVGGGVPKNFIQQAMQLAPEAASYGIQITMDRPEPGGSSGAELKEGMSWGKLNPNAQFTDVICDTTIALPLIYASVKDKKIQRK